MASQEALRRIYSPAIFGSHFNERPQPDALGRSPATPLEIQRAMHGEFNPSCQEHLLVSKPRRETMIGEYERLKQEREQRRAAARRR